MNKVNLKLLIFCLSIDRAWLGEFLFPGLDRPDRALQRVTRGEQMLNEKQISDLSQRYDISISDLFLFSDWEFSRVGRNVVSIINGDFAINYTAKAQPVLEVFNRGNVIHRSVVEHGVWDSFKSGLSFCKYDLIPN